MRHDETNDINHQRSASCNTRLCEWNRRTDNSAPRRATYVYLLVIIRPALYVYLLVIIRAPVDRRGQHIGRGRDRPPRCSHGHRVTEQN